ncbi:MAG TPA: tetratricopeptide repeat protein [Thermoanaerobaculia bacterium]
MEQTSAPGVKRHSAQGVVLLLVGALVGFAAGYFAAGGGRPSTGHAASSSGAAGSSGRVAEIQQAVDRDPENPELLTALGNAYYDEDDWDRAIASYEKARRKAPKDPNLLSDLGAAYRNRGEFDLAVAYFKKARENDPDHWQSLLNLVLVEAFDRKNPAAAQHAFDELKQRYPDVPNLDRIQSQISSLRAAG